MWISALRSVKHRTGSDSERGCRMLKVSIYIETDGSDAKKRYRTYAAIVEFITRRNETITREACGTENATLNRIMLTALVASLRILNKPCEITVHMDCPYVTETIRQGRMYEWLACGWKTTRNEPVANREEWEKVIKLTEKHELVFATAREHSYSGVLRNEIRRLKDRGMEYSQQKIGGGTA